MKKIFTLLTVILISLMVLQGQDAPPQAFSFKATIVSSNGAIVASKTVAIRLSILKNNTNGISVFTETFLPKTNEYGQVDIMIGNGTRVSGNFSTIEWSNDKYFLKVEVDVKGGRNYTLMSVTQLLSVPYAMYAKTAGGITGGVRETDPVFVSSPANHISNSNLNNWNTAFGWGNHAGLYRPIGYVPAWSEITSNPFSFSSVQNNQILKFNSVSGKWENWTPDFSNGTTETDPVFAAWNKSSGISITSSQVIDFQDNVTNNAAVMANSAKNSYPAADAAKLASIAPGADVNVNADWNATGGDAQILNKPTIPTQYTDAMADARVVAGITGKVDNVTGKGLSTEDYSTAEKNKLTAISGTNTGDETNETIKTKLGITTLSGSNTGDQDGSETKVTAGINVTVTGSGTTASPYVVNATGSSSLAIGDNYGGGIIFWLDASGQHGLIAATADQSTGVAWTTFINTVSNAAKDGVNGGQTNTERIINQAGAGSYAAQLCANYRDGNYADWYLPSKYELNLLYLQKDVVGGFANNFYWSSTEGSNIDASGQFFNVGAQYFFSKGNMYYVRAVRAF